MLLCALNSVTSWQSELYMLLRCLLKAQRIRNQMSEQQQEHPKHAEAQGWFKGEHWIWKLSMVTNYADFHRLSSPMWVTALHEPPSKPWWCNLGLWRQLRTKLAQNGEHYSKRSVIDAARTWETLVKLAF